MQSKDAILFYDLFAEADSTDSFCWICAGDTYTQRCTYKII